MQTNKRSLFALFFTSVFLVGLITGCGKNVTKLGKGAAVNKDKITIVTRVNLLPPIEKKGVAPSQNVINDIKSLNLDALFYSGSVEKYKEEVAKAKKSFFPQDIPTQLLSSVKPGEFFAIEIDPVDAYALVNISSNIDRRILGTFGLIYWSSINECLVGYTGFKAGNIYYFDSINIVLDGSSLDQSGALQGLKPKEVTLLNEYPLAQKWIENNLKVSDGISLIRLAGNKVPPVKENAYWAQDRFAESVGDALTRDLYTRPKPEPQIQIPSYK